MYLEGVDTLLYNLETDPLELNDSSGNPVFADFKAELSAILFQG